ncbi:hypothetical protein FBEOM_917 [Fusarium beomiforme]|uniref:HNH nuclease domain-containing protein n=1 Tax=Fusarium beomiforme TaxID=44412 RepID=A0A9P5E5W3_9HYPO|nr:hypothetical protein FBEOM_917 [Fusarium beomiforme]
MSGTQDSGAEPQRILADHTFQQPNHLLRSNDLKERLQYARDVESCIRKHGNCTEDFRLRAEHVARIMVAPLPAFKWNQVLSIEDQDACLMKRSLERIGPLCKHYLQHSCNRTDIDFLGDPWRRISNSNKQYTPLPTPNKNEAAKCLERDVTCIVTGEPRPSICRILPLSWNDYGNHAKIVDSLGYGLTYYFQNSFLREIYGLPSETGFPSADNVWNMLCLHPDLFKLWAKGYFAFKYLGTDELPDGTARVTLQFQWMPKMQLRFGQEVNLHHSGSENDWDAIVKEVDEFCTSIDHRPNLRMKIGSYPVSGSLSHMRMSRRKALCFRDVIQVQWVCILVAALCGAVGRPELMLKKDPDDYVVHWLKSQTRWEKAQGH